jgi:ABC-type transport system involved in multi-copper enzyme maturation permease subunit
MIRSLTRIGAIAGNTFREAVRSKLLYNLLFFAILMIVSSILLANLHLGYQARIFRDVGLSAIALFGALIAIFVGINLVYREISLKTVYTMLAKPVHRWEFLVGKYVGLAVLLLVEIAIMTAGFLVVLWGHGSPISPELFYAVGLVFVELALVTAVALFFSSFTTPYLAGMFTVALWITGHLLADVRAFGAHSEIPLVESVTEFLYWCLPNLDRLDIKSEAAAGVSIEAGRVGWAILYAAAYSSGLLLISAWLFRRRDFR